MPKKQLIIPHYCQSCKHLTFLLREAEPFQFRLLDYTKSSWESHSCAQIHPDLTEEVAQQSGYKELDESVQNIPFEHQPVSQSKKRLPLTIGVALNISVKDGSQIITVITPENQIVDVRILDNTRTVTAGKPINLKKAVRIGKNRYRLKQVEFVNPGKKTTQKQPAPVSTYQLILSAKDQEKLETFINRLVTVCYKNRSLPINVVPVPINQENDEQIFQREMNLPLESHLLQKIEKITVPESVQVTVRHT
ncbi:MAG: hypothetical protein HOE30_07430 [Deltaproteobacteria bacterium]|nr:hypothetical protein [Deltaproteobacteria bacterium]MBT4264554.1 hypothetical protein [Deltaproteobacteria bacterium]MBT4641377.1 hypothetical protein [Deltaproteobacteria bacterium]